MPVTLMRPGACGKGGVGCAVDCAPSRTAAAALVSSVLPMNSRRFMSCLLCGARLGRRVSRDGVFVDVHAESRAGRQREVSVDRHLESLAGERFTHGDVA